MNNVVQLNPHANMSVEDCLSFCSRNTEDYSDVMVIGYDKKDGTLTVRSSHMSRAEAAFLLLHALDHAKGI